MSFDLSRLGRWSDWHEVGIDAARARAYAAATNDRDPRHLAGELAPPVFAVVAAREAGQRAVRAITDETRSVHGEHDLVIRAPLPLGEVVLTRAAPIGVRVVRSGTALSVRTETCARDGTPLNEQVLTLFFIGLTGGESAGEELPDRSPPPGIEAVEPAAAAVQQVDLDQTFRYAGVSGDHTSFHIDEREARAAGFPGIILQGACTFAFAGCAAVEGLCSGDSTRLRRLAARFSAVVLPGDELTTRFRPAGAGYTFETANGRGETVLRNGLAEVA